MQKLKQDFKRAIASLRSGRPAEAFDISKSILRATPRNIDALHVSALAAAQLGQLEDAVKRYRAAIKINKDVPDIHFNLGVALNDLGRHEKAVASYARALALRPDDVDAHNNLGNALIALKRYDEAAASYGRAVQLKPGYAEAHNNLGLAL